MVEQMDAKEMARSLTGFDELAIKKMFGATFEKLDGTFAGRSLVFVKSRREGSNDAAAFKLSMEASIGEINDLFMPSEDAEGNSSGPMTN